MYQHPNWGSAVGSVVSDKYLQSCTRSWPLVTPGCRSPPAGTPSQWSSAALIIFSSAPRYHQPCYPGKRRARNIFRSAMLDVFWLLRVGHGVGISQMIWEDRNGFLDNFCCSSMHLWQLQCSKKYILRFVELIPFFLQLTCVANGHRADTKAEAAPVFNRVATRTPNS